MTISRKARCAPRTFTADLTRRRVRALTSGTGSRRQISSTSCRNSHYQTLSIPTNATRSQIKASFYKLSKLHHPDVAKDSSSKEKFQELSAAYAVLGDDRKRRAYDRSLHEASNTRPSPASPHHTHTPWSYDLRTRRGATYAWDQARRAEYGHHKPPPEYTRPGTHPSQHPHAHRTRPHVDPFTSPYVQRATGRAAREQQKSSAEAGNISRESGMWRAVQVIGLVFIIATIGGGFSVRA